MAKKKSASLTGALLARKGEARAVGFALESDQAMDTAGAPKRPAPPPPPREERDTNTTFTPDRRPEVVISGLLGEDDLCEDDRLARPYPPLEKKRVLIVEDNDLDMKLFRHLLELHGCSILRARDGREALALAHESRPDLILMDMHLPGASGLEVTRWFKADDDLRSIPVIAATAHVMEGEAELFVDQGCETCIAKPISITAFLRTCARVLPPAG